MADIYAIWYAAQIAQGETMQDGLLRVANLLQDPAAVPPGYAMVPIDELANLRERADFNVVEFAHAQRENPGPFVGLAGTPNAMIAAAGDKPCTTK